MSDFNTYLSPFTWRYSSVEMRRIWSEEHKRLLWRRIWVVLAEVQADYGLLSSAQVADLREHAEQVNVPRALEIEAEIQHDLMAELKVFAEQSTVGGGGLHLGATSMDIEDNADALRIRQSLDIILNELKGLLLRFVEKVYQWADFPIIGFTHLQPAEPSTFGYRLCQYAQDLFSDWENLNQVRNEIKGKGFKGAVGTGASYAELIGVENLTDFEMKLSQILDLPFFPITTQTYPRKQDYHLISALAGMGASLYKFAFDLRILQSPSFGELSESFTSKQVGSSAMPFKRNPIKSEKIDSLARAIARMPGLAWDNASHQLLERTLDDSANRRTLLPEAFLVSDELLRVSSRIIENLQVDDEAIKHNLSIYGPFAASERVLMALGKAGADRQVMHERLRRHAMRAWETTQSGGPNPLVEDICQDPIFLEYLGKDDLYALMDVKGYLGDAAQRAKTLASVIKNTLS